MNKREFERKYKTEIALMAKNYNVDMGVAYGMLVEHGRDENHYRFEGCEEIDYTGLAKDVAEMDAEAKGKRVQAGLE